MIARNDDPSLPVASELYQDLKPDMLWRYLKLYVQQRGIPYPLAAVKVVAPFKMLIEHDQRRRRVRPQDPETDAATRPTT